MQRGMSTFRAVDYYDPEGSRRTSPWTPCSPLSRMPPNTIGRTTRPRPPGRCFALQMEKGRRELEYLNSVLENISLAEGGAGSAGDPAGSWPRPAISAVRASQRPRPEGLESPWSFAPPPVCGSRWARTTAKTTGSPPSRRNSMGSGGRGHGRRNTCDPSPRQGSILQNASRRPFHLKGYRGLVDTPYVVGVHSRGQSSSHVICISVEIGGGVQLPLGRQSFLVIARRLAITCPRCPPVEAVQLSCRRLSV